MRKFMLLLAVVGLAGSLWAADPAVGTWKLNVAKSRFAPSTQAAIKTQTLVIREAGDQSETTITGTRTDGSPISAKFTFPPQGGVWKYQQGGFAEGVSGIGTRIDADTVIFTTIQNGKQIEMEQCAVTKDGKALNCRVKGTDAKGKPFEALTVYDKQ